MTIVSDRPSLAKLAGIQEDGPIGAAAMAPDVESHEPRHSSIDRLQTAFDFALAQLPDQNAAPQIHEAYAAFKEGAFVQGGEALGMFGESVRMKARGKVARDETRRQQDLNELCGGGDTTYVAPREVVDMVIKKTLVADGAATEIVDRTGFFHERLEDVRKAASSLIINNSLEERATFRRGYNDERHIFNVGENDAFSDVNLASETEPLVEGAISSVVEQLGAELKTLREARVARIAMGGAMTPAQQREAFLKAISEANGRIANVLKLKNEDSEMARIAERVLKDSGYTEVDQANMLVFKNKKEEFVHALTSGQKVSLLASGLASTKEYQYLKEIGLQTSPEDFSKLEITPEVLTGMSVERFSTMVRQEMDALRDSHGKRASQRVVMKYGRKLHPDHTAQLDLSERDKNHLEELSKALLKAQDEANHDYGNQ